MRNGVGGLAAAGVLLISLCAAAPARAAGPDEPPPPPASPPAQSPLTPPDPSPPVRPWPSAFKVMLNPPGEGVTVMLNRWSVTTYGVVELDAIYDSTQSFADQVGHAMINRGDTYAGTHGRTLFGVRDSRLGWRIDSPPLGDGRVRASGLVELDFNPPNVPPINNQPESAYFTSPYPRLRHAALRIETPYVDIIAGQYWNLIGFITYFDPSSIEIQFVPGALAARTPQLRFSHTLRSQRVNLELAAAVLRSPQNNSAVPSGEFGARLLFNQLHALRTDYAVGPTVVDRAGLAVSGTVRRLTAPAYFPGGTPPLVGIPELSTLGWAVAVDFLMPLIPKRRRTGNALTLTANFVRGRGLADLFSAPAPGSGGGLPAPPGCVNPTTGVAVAGCIDPGLVAVNTTFNSLQAIGWQSLVVGLQYYLPPRGNAWVSAIYSQLQSDNLAQFADRQKGWALARYVNASLMYDLTPAVRLGVGYALYIQYNLDGAESRNHRAQVSTYYRF
jgi:hypothetical protein